MNDNEPFDPSDKDPEAYAPGKEEEFDSRSLAKPNCKYCKGKGQVMQKRLSGILAPVWCICTKETLRKLSAEMRIGDIFPGRLGRMTFATYDTGGNAQNAQALKVAKNFYNHWPDARASGWIVGFHGPSSAGKTHLTVATAIACVKKYFIRPYFLSMPRMLQLQKDTFSAEKTGQPTPLDMAINADLLVLDDLGAEYIKSPGQGKVSFAEDFLYQVLDERIILDRPILYTTNYTKSGMEKYLPMRIYERLARNQTAEAQEVVLIKKKSRVNLKDRDLLLGDD